MTSTRNGEAGQDVRSETWTGGEAAAASDAANANPRIISVRVDSFVGIRYVIYEFAGISKTTGRA